MTYMGRRKAEVECFKVASEVVNGLRRADSDW